MSSLPRRRAAAASSGFPDGPPPSRVLLYGASQELELLVRHVVFGEIEVVARGGEQPDLVVADTSQLTPALLDQARAEAPGVPILILSPSSGKAANLRVSVLPADIGTLTMGQVMQRFGRVAVATYLPALLRQHAGNVTRAARAAGLERESLHRLLRRYRLRAEGFRS